MVAKAELGIVITDSGASFVGAPAPQGVAYPGVSQQTGGDGASASSKSKSPIAATVSDALKDAARQFGFGGVYSAAERLKKSFDELTDASKKRAKVETAESTVKKPPAAKQPEYPYQNFSVDTTQVAPSFPAPPPVPANAGSPAGGSAAEAVEGTAALGSSAATAAAAIAGVAVAAGLAAKALHDQADVLAKFSPEVAGANAQNEIREMMAEMRRAQRIGPDLAEFEDERGRAQETLSDLLTEVLKVLLAIWKMLSPFFESIIALFKAAIAILQPELDAVTAIANFVTGHLPAAAKNIEEMMGHLKGLPAALENAFNGNVDPLTANPFATGFMALGRPDVNDVRNAPQVAPIPAGF